jgi:hypothetical protein
MVSFCSKHNSTVYKTPIDFGNSSVFNKNMVDIEKLASSGILSIYKKRNEWYIHIQKETRFGILSPGIYASGLELKDAIKKLANKTEN